MYTERTIKPPKTHVVCYTNKLVKKPTTLYSTRGGVSKCLARTLVALKASKYPNGIYWVETK